VQQHCAEHEEKANKRKKKSNKKHEKARVAKRRTEKKEGTYGQPNTQV